MGINDDDDEADKIPTHHLGFCLLGFCPLGLILHTDEMTMMLIEEVQIMSSILSRHNFFLGLFLIQTKIFKDIYIYLMVFTGGHLESHS